MNGDNSGFTSGIGMEDEQLDEEFNDVDNGETQDTQKVQEANGDSKTDGRSSTVPPIIPDIPELSRKDKTLKEVLDLMEDQYAPIIPDAVTDYYLAKNGFESSDIKIKRLIALATQKFVSDIAQDAYEYSRIRNASSVYNSSNPQVRAKQLLQGQQYANQHSITGANGSSGMEGDQQQPSYSTNNSGHQQGKIVLTMDDLSSALSEYGLNTSRPDFYR